MNYFPGVISPEPNVATQSGERKDMQADLDLIEDVRSGLPAMKAKRSVYLPRYEQESQGEYDRRSCCSPWRPEFADALQALASKPFSKPVALAEGASDEWKQFAEDVDGRGNSLHVFARNIFLDAIANGVHAVMVDYPNVTYRNLAEEKAAGPRPYWLSISIADIVAVYTEMRAGREVVTHLRLRECHIEHDGYRERKVECVRVYEPGKWELWEKQENSGDYTMIDSGEMLFKGEPTTEVFIAFLFTGKRTGTLKVRPPLRDLADMQVELYRALSRQDEILTYAGSPMLGTSLQKPDPNKSDGNISVGPKVVLYGSGTTDRPPWAYVQPDAANIKEVREQVQSVIEDFRHLAMQPTVARSGDVTATAASVNAAKAHSALEAWAINLKDMLEQTFVFTAQWMADKKPPAVTVFTDFGIGAQDVEQARVLGDAQKRSVISKKAERVELKRRNILSADYDSDADDQQIATELVGLEPEQPIDPRNGNIIPYDRSAA
jgi:hypothetical protein